MARGDVTRIPPSQPTSNKDRVKKVGIIGEGRTQETDPAEANAVETATPVPEPPMREAKTSADMVPIKSPEAIDSLLMEEWQAELEWLKSECLTKNGDPKVDASTDKLARIDELTRNIADAEDIAKVAAAVAFPSKKFGGFKGKGRYSVNWNKKTNGFEIVRNSDGQVVKKLRRLIHYHGNLEHALKDANLSLARAERAHSQRLAAADYAQSR